MLDTEGMLALSIAVYSIQYFVVLCLAAVARPLIRELQYFISRPQHRGGTWTLELLLSSGRFRASGHGCDRDAGAKNLEHSVEVCAKLVVCL